MSKGKVKDPGKVARMAAKEAEERRKDEDFLKMMDSKKGSTQRTAASEDAYSYKCGGKVKYSTGGGVCAGGRSAIRGTKFSGVN